jgi:Ran GTPase-activating protein (RanGAP) involved in mRNA processing and transport
MDDRMPKELLAMITAAVEGGQMQAWRLVGRATRDAVHDAAVSLRLRQDHWPWPLPPPLISSLSAAEASALRRFPNARSVTAHDLCSDGARTLLDHLGAQTALRRLDLTGLWDFGIGASGSKPLGRVLERNPALQHLELSGADLGDAGLADVAAALARLPGLRHLGLGSNGLADGPCLGRALSAARPPALRCLDLRSNNIGVRGALGLASALAAGALPALQRLVLFGNPLRCAGARAVTAALAHVPTLRHLDLGAVGLGRVQPGSGDGHEAVAAALEETSTLALALDWNEGADEGLTTTRVLTGDVGLALLVPRLSALKGVEYLRLDCNDVGDLGAARLATSLPLLPALTELDLSNNDVRDHGAARLAQVLPRLTALGRLGLVDTKVADAGREALGAAALPHQRICF